MLEYRIREEAPLTLMFHGKMDEPTETAGPQWFDAMNNILDRIKGKEEASELQTMSYLQYANLYFPD